MKIAVRVVWAVVFILVAWLTFETAESFSLLRSRMEGCHAKEQQLEKALTDSEVERMKLKDELKQCRVPPPISKLAGDVDDLATRLWCITEHLKFSEKIEESAGLPVGWLSTHVFGKRKEPNYDAFNTLPRWQQKLLYDAMKANQHPGENCENITRGEENERPTNEANSQKEESQGAPEGE